MPVVEQELGLGASVVYKYPLSRDGQERVEEDGIAALEEQDKQQIEQMLIEQLNLNANDVQGYSVSVDNNMEIQEPNNDED